MLKIIGIGNTLRGDDGIGPYIINELKKEKLPEAVQLLDIGSDAFSVIDHLICEHPVLVIDCAQMDKKPGEVVKFNVEEKNLSILEKAISLHGFGFTDVYKMAKKLNDNIQCTIIGVQPKLIQFNSGLSEEVKNSIPSIIKLVMEETNKYVKKNNNN
jgi:hydrogenase maturation protease